MTGFMTARILVRIKWFITRKVKLEKKASIKISSNTEDRKWERLVV